MKFIFLFLLAFSSFISFAITKYRGVPAKYHALLETAIQKAGSNGTELLGLLNRTEKKKAEATAFLIAYMPDNDLKTVSGSFIKDQVDWAYQAKKCFNWCKKLPDSIFFNEVLPYYCLDEKRDNWRRDFYMKFGPLVRNCRSVNEAIDSVNLNIRELLKVEYNTKRSVVNISPFQAMEEKMATCTGLSFLLIDAFRSVGIPARLAGTPLWTNLRGNHNWVEVWIDGQWYFTEYYPDKLNKSWFVADAGKADPENPQHWIYAASYKPAATWFPMVWAPESREVNAWNVTDRYIRLYQEQLEGKETKDDKIIVNVVVYRDKSLASESTGRVSEKVTVLEGDSLIDFGFSPRHTDDLNRFLKFSLKRNSSYIFSIEKDGKVVKKEELQTSNQNEGIISLYLN